MKKITSRLPAFFISFVLVLKNPKFNTLIYRDFEIAALIARIITGEAGDEETAALEKWKGVSAENRALYDRLTSSGNLRELEAMSQRYDSESGWKVVRGLMDVSTKRRRRPLRIAATTAVAAVALLLVVLPPLLKDRKAQTPETAAVIVPGGFRATLTLADGSTVALGEDSGEAFARMGIALSDATIDYERSAATEDDDARHVLDVPKGGECRIILSDGTVVWVNSMTTLRYPVKFTGDTRLVELSGEAYFEVSHGATSFIVHTADMDVRVHGTSFNVSAYADSRTVEATLVNGSVSVDAGGVKNRMITPSQQARFDRESGMLAVENVDPTLYTSWKEGQLRFKDCKLEEIMQTLARWYDIEEVYYETDEIRNMLFGLNLDRYDTIIPILDLLNRTGVVTARIDGKRILFSE